MYLKYGRKQSSDHLLVRGMLSTYHENNKTVPERQRWSEHQNANKNSTMYFSGMLSNLANAGYNSRWPMVDFWPKKLARQRIIKIADSP